MEPVRPPKGRYIVRVPKKKPSQFIRVVAVIQKLRHFPQSLVRSTGREDQRERG